MGAGFAWLAGACVALVGAGWPAWAPAAAAGLLAALGCSAWLATRRRPRAPATRLARRIATLTRAAPVLACLLAGFATTGSVAQRQLQSRWPASLDGERVLLEGRVASLPVDRGGEFDLDLDGEVIAPRSLQRPLRVRVSGRLPGAPPQAGERWRLLLRLRPPRRALNPGGGDPERLLFRERIDALGTVVPSALAQRVARAAPGWDPLRAAIAARIREAVADRDAAALIAGLAVGATGEMSREQWRVFNATGTVHLVAISGLHVTLFAWLATRVARRGWRLARLGRRLDREPFAASCGLLAALGYALLAGLSVPTQRTLVMLAAWWGARLVGRRQGSLEVLGIALLAVLAWDPLAPLAAGFWLSFTAIAVLMSGERGDTRSAGDTGAAGDTGNTGDAVEANEPAGTGDGTGDGAGAGHPADRSRRGPGGVAASPLVGRVATWFASRARVAGAACLNAAREMWTTQWRITLALAPATLALFASVPVAGLAANALAIPFFSILLVPLVLASLAAWPFAPQLAVAGWQFAERAILAAWPTLEAMAGWPASNVFAEPGALGLVVGLFAVPLVLLPGPWLLRATLPVALLPLFGTAVASPETGGFRAWLLDAGDGVALVVLTRTHTIVYDTGDVHGSDGRRAAQLLLPALRALGRDHVDLAVQSRANGYRVSGIAALLDGTTVRRLQSGGDWRAGPAPLEACEREAGWVWDGVELRVFPASASADIDARAAPRADSGVTRAAAPSCVLRVAAEAGRGTALLVPGQVDRAEALALAGAGRAARLRADVVLAPRRGSIAPLEPGWVAAIAPRQVLVASREFGPLRRARVAAAWGVDPAAVRATAEEGALVVDVRQRPAAAAIARHVDALPPWPWRLPRVPLPDTRHNAVASALAEGGEPRR